MPIIVLLVLAVAGFFLWQRANELFCLSVRDGETLLVRGRLPVGLQQGLSDVVRRAGIRSGTIRGVRASSHARLVTRGIDERTTQQLRNVFGLSSVQKLRAAALPSSRNLGQILGWAWLAWLLLPRR